MNSTMSENDKKVLFIGGLIILIVVSIFLIIIPTSKKISKVQIDNKTLNQKQEEMESSINNIESFKKTKSDLEDEYKEANSKVFNNFNECDIESTVSKMVADNGLNPKTVNMTAFNGIKVLPFTSSKTYKDEKVSCGIVADEKSKNKAANVIISAEGPAQNILKFLNVLDSQSGIFIQESKITLGNDKSKIDVTISLVLGENEF